MLVEDELCSSGSDPESALLQTISTWQATGTRSGAHCNSLDDFGEA